MNLSALATPRLRNVYPVVSKIEHNSAPRKYVVMVQAALSAEEAVRADKSGVAGYEVTYFEAQGQMRKARVHIQSPAVLQGPLIRHVLAE